VTVDGKPIFAIFNPTKIPDMRRVADLWRDLANKAGLNGLHLLGVSHGQRWDPKDLGLDASTDQIIPRLWPTRRRPLAWLRRKAQLPLVYNYEAVLDELTPAVTERNDKYPCLIHAWDNSPRAGNRAVVLHGSTPQLFQKILRRTLERRAHVPLGENIILLKSWNEWAEGNHLEPDLRFGRGYLDVIRQEVSAPAKRPPAAAGDQC
jgi:hypothetical protein